MRTLSFVLCSPLYIPCPTWWTICFLCPLLTGVLRSSGGCFSVRAFSLDERGVAPQAPLCHIVWLPTLLHGSVRVSLPSSPCGSAFAADTAHAPPRALSSAHQCTPGGPSRLHLHSIVPELSTASKDHPADPAGFIENPMVTLQMSETAQRKEPEQESQVTR